MPFKRVALTAGVVAKLTEIDPNRKVIVVSNYFTTANYVVEVFDDSARQTAQHSFIIPISGGVNTRGASSLTLRKSELDATEKAWFAYSAFSMQVFVFEGF